MPTTITLVFALLVAIVVLAMIATRFRLPYAIVLVLGGLALGFVPGLPTIDLDPELLLFLFLPPLIYSSAWLTSWREFRGSLRPILLLAIGLVLATMIVVAVVAHMLIGLSWPVAFVLGAIVSPTDAVAASATAQSAGLSRRLVTVIEGESMVNDATGLVMYRFALAAVVSGSFSLAQASLQFVLVSLGGLLLGLVISWLVAWFHRFLDDAPIEIALTLLTPFAAYLLAEALHVSGVLAVMAAGLSLSRQSSRLFSANTRLQVNAVWNVLVFLFNGFVFLLIGLQLHSVLGALTNREPWTLLWEALLISLTVMLLRLLWVLPAAFPTRLFGLLGRYLGSSRVPTPASWRNVLILAWTGMRGGVSLAAALALTGFPGRELVLFLTFCVILATLVGQGLSLGPLIRLLHLPEDGTPEREHAKAHLVAARAALSRLDELEREGAASEEDLAYLRPLYQDKVRIYYARAHGEAADAEQERVSPLQKRRLRQEILRAERVSVIRLRDRRLIDDEVLRVVERELDLEEQRLGIDH